MEDRPQVAIMVLNWNNFPDTDRCLQSLERLSYDNFQVTVIDNGSTDGSNQQLKARYPQYRQIELPDNLGFAGGNNRALRKVLEQDIPYILLLNNDTEVSQGDFLSKLVQEMELDQDLGAIGPLVNKPDGTPEQTICPYPTLGNTIQNTLGLFKPDLFRKQYVDGVAGSCVLIRAASIREVGLLDENFFMYVEETEWFYRMRQAGWKVLYTPLKSIMHKGESSSRRLDNQKIYNERRSNVVYTMVKHGQTVQAFLVAVLMVGLLSVRVLTSRFSSMQPRLSFKMVENLIHQIRTKWQLAGAQRN